VQYSETELRATPASAAYGSIDLLTVVTHELGHVLGFEDIDAVVGPDALMSATLDVGVRRLVPETETGTDEVSQRATDADTEGAEGGEAPADVQSASVLVFDDLSGAFRTDDAATAPPQGYVLDLAAFGPATESNDASPAGATQPGAASKELEPDAESGAPDSASTSDAPSIDWHGTFATPVAPLGRSEDDSTTQPA
jgi:hypothetical protein